MTIQTTLVRYQQLASELAVLYYELAKIDNAILEDWDSAYLNAVSEGLSYNPAAAQAKSVVRRWTMERNKIQGEIEARLVELRYMDQYLKYYGEG